MNDKSRTPQETTDCLSKKGIQCILSMIPVLISVPIDKIKGKRRKPVIHHVLKPLRSSKLYSKLVSQVVRPR